MFSHTLSSILRGKWLIEPAFAKSQLPMVLQMLKGEAHGGEQAAMAKDRIFQMSKTAPAAKINMAASCHDIYAVSPYTSMDRLPDNSIAVVNITGVILKYGDYCTYGTVEYSDLFMRLANTNRVRGIIVNIDTPGGQADGTAHLAATIREVWKQKPVLGICQDGIVASAGMWIASSFQEFYVTQETDQVGSIGAFCTIYDFAQWFEMNGIKVHDIFAPQSDDKCKDYRDALQGDYSLIKEDLKFLVQSFINTVKAGRGQRLNTKSENPFTGKMYNAADAKAIGLIDGIKNMAAVVKRTEQLISLRA